jgi:hypothetical protein
MEEVRAPPSKAMKRRRLVMVREGWRKGEMEEALQKNEAVG